MSQLPHTLMFNATFQQCAVFVEKQVQLLKMRELLAKMDKEEQAHEWVAEYGKWLVRGDPFCFFVLADCGW